MSYLIQFLSYYYYWLWCKNSFPWFDNGCSVGSISDIQKKEPLKVILLVEYYCCYELKMQTTTVSIYYSC